MSLPIRIDLPESFLQKEERCGYEVTEKQKKIWAIELDLLKCLLDVCKKNNIKVQVFAGTLLGAIRHDGFIPWDDDIDVAMTRSEFNRLCNIAGKEFGAPYFFQTAITDGKYYLPYARLRNSRTTAIIKGQESIDYNNGIYIDVFVLDGISTSKILNQIQLVLMRVFCSLCTVRTGEKNSKHGTIGYIIRSLYWILKVIPLAAFHKLYAFVLSMYSRKAEYLGLRTHFRFGEKYCIPKEAMNDTMTWRFENMHVPIPVDYDNVLRKIYGDYDKFPPVSVRGKWHQDSIYFNPDKSYKDALLSAV